jgi:nanoRNase/pAp phosphatase (c-di-AMP/oligoRNAs hydrolase)
MPFAAAYYDTLDGHRSWSLRSVGDFDVAALAKRWGGGGHKNASGFTESEFVPPPPQ